MMHTELLNIVLDEQKLKFDRSASGALNYSLRHRYICLRLMEGADIYQIAKSCRTRVKMIEDFYAAHIKDLFDTASINVRRPRTYRKRDTQTTESHTSDTT